MIYRRFGYLHNRLLLQKQDELRVMEEELETMDRKDLCSDDPGVLQCREEDEAHNDQSTETRKSLFSRIEKTLLKYGISILTLEDLCTLIRPTDEILLHARQLILSNRPAGRDYNSVKNFMWNEKPLMQGDAEFIYNREDLITLRPGRETAWLDVFVERTLKLFPRRLVQYIFCSKVSFAN